MPGETSQRLRARLEHAVGVVLLHGAWLLCAFPVVTWLGSSVAMVHSLDRWIMHGDDRFLHNFWYGWRLHWRRTLPIGAASGLVFALMLANLLFLMTRDSAPAVVLLMGTIGLMLMWAIVNLAFVPVIVLFPQLSTRRCLRESFVMAFRHPLSMIGVVLGCLITSSVLLRIFAPLVILGVGVTAYLGLRLCYRNLTVPRRDEPRSETAGLASGGSIR